MFLFYEFQSQTTSALIHGELKLHSDNSETNHRDESGIERLPDEHVSIVETTDDREIARPVGTTRRKLYFNPSYFEPHLMAVIINKMLLDTCNYVHSLRTFINFNRF